MRINLIVISLFIAAQSGIAAEKYIILDDETLSGKPLGPFAYYLDDGSGRLTIEDVSAGRASLLFAPSEREIPSFGFTTDPIWLRFTAENPGNTEREWYLEVGYGQLDSLELYVPDGSGGFSVRAAGDHRPYFDREYDHENFIFRLSEKPGRHTYFLRVQTGGSVNVPLYAWSLDRLTTRNYNSHIMLGIFYGILLIMLAYNLIIYFSSFDPDYLIYVLFSMSFILVTLALNSVGFRFLWPDTLWMNDSIPFIMPMADALLVLFTMSFLDTKLHTPRIHKVLIAVIALLVSDSMLCFFLPYSVTITIATQIQIASTALLLGISVLYLLKGYRSARFYFPGGIILIAGIILTSLKNSGQLPNNFITVWGYMFGFTVQLVLLSFALADKLNNLKKQYQALNVNLEKSIRARTLELEKALGEKERVNIELSAARDALWGEMQLAKKIQTILLPRKPAIPGYEIYGLTRPSEQVGGDYFDVINAAETDWIVIGDVSGHGVPAGLVMMMVQTAIHVAVIQDPNRHPSDLLTVINEVLYENIKQMGDDKYMTITVLAAHRDGCLIFSGLHQSILVYRKASGDVEIVRTRGMWLGITKNIGDLLHDDCLKMDPDDVMLLCTDGITESYLKDAAVIDNESMYGHEKLEKVFSESAALSANKIIEKIFASLEPYRLHDDVTLMVVRRLPE
ncbi:MAG: SpoIIE family protein phosphatase [Spirochaetes bacterium]|jgi:serine phosphatase RsbU (regulator of sigma subunit)|nr:SpoIIE family protein phosphatase [Spirochaetota bacterium]